MQSAQLVIAVEGPSIHLLLSSALDATIQDATTVLAFATETPGVAPTNVLPKPRHMIIPSALLEELCYSDPATHLFADIRRVRKPLGSRTLGVYGARLDAANFKVRYAADALVRLLKILDGLGHGEFIYFDDESRLAAHAALESFLVFLRATLDLVTAAWWAYHTDQIGLDSFHDLLKKLKQGVAWAPLTNADGSPTLPGKIVDDFESDAITWLDAVVGKAKGMSLRDLAMHRSVLELNPMIDERDKGFIAITLSSDSIGEATAWTLHVYESASRFVLFVRSSIQADEPLG
jgi:hypothetical protein